MIHVRLYNKVVGTCFVNKVCCIMIKTGTRLKKYKIQVFRCIKKRKVQEKYNPNGKKGIKKEADLGECSKGQNLKEAV